MSFYAKHPLGPVPRLVDNICHLSDSVIAIDSSIDLAYSEGSKRMPEYLQAFTEISTGINTIATDILNF